MEHGAHDRTHETEKSPYVFAASHPFDARAELARLQKKGSEEGMPAAERRTIKRERLADYKEALSIQEETLCTATHSMRTMIEENSDRTAEELMKQVETVAEQGRFTSSIIDQFDRACVTYEYRHGVVKRYGTEYAEKPAALFTRCFDVEPQGRIELIVRPLSLCFLVYDHEDYVRAFAHDITREGKSPIADSVRKDAQDSAGVFFNDEESIFVPDLKRCVGLIKKENDDINPKISQEDESLIEVDDVPAHSGYTFSFQEMESARFFYENDSFFAIQKTPGKGGGHAGSKVSVFINEVCTMELEGVFEYEEKAGNGIDQNKNHVNRMNDNESLPPRWKIIQFPTSSREGEVVSQVFLPFFFSNEIVQLSFVGRLIDIENRSEKIMRVERRYAPEKKDTNQSVQEEKTIVHEEEHAWNALFSPIETIDLNARIDAHLSTFELLKGETSGTLAERGRARTRLHQALLEDCIRYLRRQFGIDARARDELLAYWKEGRSSAEIEHILTKWTKKSIHKNQAHGGKERSSNLYNYRKLYKERIIQIPKWMNSIAINFLKQRHVQADKSKISLFLAEFMFDASPSIRTRIVKKVFEEEYAQLIARSCDVFDSLVQKGYTRDEICALLTPIPLSGWTGFDRRHPIEKNLVG